MTVLPASYLDTAKHALIFGLGNLGNRVLAFVLLPIYTSYLSTADYGLLAITAVTSSLLSIALTMGLSTSIFKEYFLDDAVDRRKTVVSTALLWLCASGFLVTVALWPLAPTLALVLFGTQKYALYLRLLLLTVPFAAIQSIPLAVFRAQRKSWQYAALSLASFSVGAMLNIYFVAFAGLGVLGILVASLITAVVFAATGILLCRHELVLSLSPSILTALLRYGLPLVPSTLGSFVLVQSDRYFLQHFSTMSSVGLYSLAYQFGVMINVLLVQPFQLIWLPTVFEARSRADAKQFYEGMLTHFVLFASWVALALSLLGREVIAWITTPAFHGAYKTIPWIAYAYVVYGGYMVVNIGIYLKSRTSYAIWILGGAACANVALNLLLIPPLGALGAALATLFSYIILFLLSWQVNRRIFALQYQWGRILKVVLVVLVLLGAGGFAPDNRVVSVFMKCVLLVAFWFLLVAVGFFTRDELVIVARSVRRWANGWRQELAGDITRHLAP